MPVNYFRSSGEELKDVTPDEWDVDIILQHRVRDGKLEFLTMWEGFDTTQATWEGVAQFFPRFNEQLFEYCLQHKLRVDVLEQFRKSSPETA